MRQSSPRGFMKVLLFSGPFLSLFILSLGVYYALENLPETHQESLDEVTLLRVSEDDPRLRDGLSHMIFGPDGGAWIFKDLKDEARWYELNGRKLDELKRLYDSPYDNM